MVKPLAAADMTETSTSSSPNVGHDSGDVSTAVRTPSGSGSSEQEWKLSVEGPRPAKQELDGTESLNENKSEGEEEEEGDVEDVLVLEEDPIEMASWEGQASIKGGSEVMQMVLLSFIAIGITCAFPFSMWQVGVMY